MIAWFWLFAGGELLGHGRQLGQTGRQPLVESEVAPGDQGRESTRAILTS